MSFTRDEILKLYSEQAAAHGLGGTSTIQDMRTRTLEMEAILSYLTPGMRVLEVGCGNGYVAQWIAERIEVEIEALDFSEDMIRLAQRRDLSGALGRVTYRQQDVLDLEGEATHDLAFTERCLQNLETWDDQKRALSNVAAAIRPGGELLLLESFWTGLNNMNAARRELDLDEISPPWHNLYFDEEKTKEHVASQGFDYVGQDCFLSGYYFGSRVLLPALMPPGKPVTSQSALNDYFCGLPPCGDFSPMKILRFRRR